MDEVNINQYLSQFNPILIVPILSAVVGAILVFIFGFKRPNEPRFQSSSSVDSLKKSKRKANTTKISDNNAQTPKLLTSPAKVGTSKKPTSEKSNNNNNNINTSNNNGVNKKKNDEKNSENGSPTKKITNKKTGKETTVSLSKKLKTIKNTLSEYNEKPADFDDAGWFTVQSKSTKQKNKVDDSAGNQNGNPSPKVQGMKINKPPKNVKPEVKQFAIQVISGESTNVPENLMIKKQSAGQKIENGLTPTEDEKVVVAVEAQPIFEMVEEKSSDASVPLNSVDLQTVESVIVFDELGEWTDAKPDRKKGNKKKSRKD